MLAAESIKSPVTQLLTVKREIRIPLASNPMLIKPIQLDVIAVRYA